MEELHPARYDALWKDLSRTMDEEVVELFGVEKYKKALFEEEETRLNGLHGKDVLEGTCYKREPANGRRKMEKVGSFAGRLMRKITS